MPGACSFTVPSLAVTRRIETFALSFAEAFAEQPLTTAIPRRVTGSIRASRPEKSGRRDSGRNGIKSPGANRAVCSRAYFLLAGRL